MYQFSPLIESVLSGLSITRWNTFPRVREITSLDHLAFIAHTSILLALLSWEKYDIGLILRKVLFSGFFTFTYSDVSSDVKHRLRVKNPELIDALERWVLDFLLANPLPEAMKWDIEKIFTTTPEDTIIAFAKAWSSYYEIYNNSIVYPDAYAKLLKNIEARALEIQIPEVEHILDFNPHNQTDTERFLLVIHRLASSFRWNRSQRATPVSVLSHTYIITFFTYCIGVLERFDEDTITDMMLTALYHDIPEAITGDIITPTKKAVPGLESAIETVEHEMVHDYLLSYIADASFHDMLARKMLAPWREPHGSLVKLADTLSAYYEARIETPHNPHYEQVVERLKKTLLDSEKGYIKYLV